MTGSGPSDAAKYAQGAADWLAEAENRHEISPERDEAVSFAAAYALTAIALAMAEEKAGKVDRP